MFWTAILIFVSVLTIANLNQISVSDFLPWTIRNALKLSKNGAEDLKMSVISSRALDERAAFFVPPLKKELDRQYTWTEVREWYALLKASANI